MTEGRKFTSWQGEDLSPEYDFTDPFSSVHVVWEEVEVGGRAWKGEADVGTVPLRDELGETGNELNLPAGLTRVSLAAHNRWRWSEQHGSNTMARGWIGPKDYMRDLDGGLRADRYREVRMSVLDANEQLKGIIVDENRQEEEDTERVEWVRSTYLAGSPRPTTNISATYVSSSNIVTLPEQRVVGDPRSILAECASFANKEVFVTSDEELFYDGWDSTAYAAGLRISDRLSEITVGQSQEGESSVRLYPSTAVLGSGGGEGGAAPPLTVSDIDAAWEEAAGSFNNYQYMFDTPAGSAGNGEISWAAVNSSVRDVVFQGWAHRLDGDLLSIIQNGGVVIGQHRMRSRSGIGINEDAQLNYPEFCIRVYRPSTGLFVATLVDVGDATGTIRFAPAGSSSPTNRTFGPFTFAGFASAADGDYVVLDAGTRHDGPVTGGTGATIHYTDTAGSDLPIANGGTTALNSWWQFGPPEDVLPTFPPIWDVGPASTEDGQQLLSGLRMYYGQSSNTYVYVNSPVTANQYAHYEESLTAPANITTAAAATTLAQAVLNRRRFEDRNINVSIGPLTVDQAALVKYGQLIDIKARAIAYADDQFFTGRIRQLRWTTPVPGMFFAHMQIERPVKETPYGVGNRAGSEAVTAHVLQGSNAHPEFVLRGTLTTQGDLPYRGASDWTRLAIGASNTWLKSIGTIPKWETLPTSGSSLTIEEEDGSPTGVPDTLKFPNTRLTDNGDGSFSVSFPAAGGSPVYDIERRTAGDISVSSTTVGNALGTIGDVVVAAAAGDLVMVGLSTRTTDADAGSVRFDAKCITGATENFVSSLGTTAASTGLSQWFRHSAISHGIGGEVPYVVQAADVSGGNLTLRLCCWVSGGTHDIAAQTAAPLLFWVRNLGQ